jgi:hypothetical protein
MFGKGNGLSASHQASSYSIIKTKTENQLKKAVMDKLKVQNEWAWIRAQTKFEILLRYHTT